MNAFGVLDRYVLRSVLVGVGMVVFVLLSLGGLFLLIGQQDDIGIGRYTALAALQFVVLNLPQQAWELLPISALIGALIGLGNLARGSELIVMQRRGFPCGGSPVRSRSPVYSSRSPVF